MVLTATHTSCMFVSPCLRWRRVSFSYSPRLYLRVYPHANAYHLALVAIVEARTIRSPIVMTRSEGCDDTPMLARLDLAYQEASMLLGTDKVGKEVALSDETAEANWYNRPRSLHEALFESLTESLLGPMHASSLHTSSSSLSPPKMSPRSLASSINIASSSPSTVADTRPARGSRAYRRVS